MADILPFKRKPNPKPKREPKFEPKPEPRRSALCANGHHRWQAVKADPFAVKQGRLITRYRCQRCGAERVDSR